METTPITNNGHSQSSETRSLIADLLPGDMSPEQIADILVIRLKDDEHQAFMTLQPGDNACIINVQHGDIEASLPEFKIGTNQYGVKILAYGRNNSVNVHREPTLSSGDPIVVLRLIDFQFDLGSLTRINPSQFGSNVKLIPDIGGNILGFLEEKYRQSRAYTTEQINDLGFYARIFEVIGTLDPLVVATK